MQIVSLEEIEIRDRKRKMIAAGPLAELKDGILSVGNLHPPVFWFDKSTQKWVLSVGERRTRAIQAIAKEGKTYYANNQKIEPGTIGILELSEFLDEAGRLEAEIYENIQREDFTWQERAQALADLHALRSADNPNQTLRQTGEELVEKNTFESPKAAAKAVSHSTIIANNLSDPSIAKARNAKEAYQLILKKQQEQLDAAIARRVIRDAPLKPVVEIRHGDLTIEMAGLPGEFVDLILADPPYGIGAGSGGFRSRTVHHHNYDDSPENAKEVALHILTEGFRVCKPRANLFMFCDIHLFSWLQVVAANMGWKPFPRPGIWGKSDSEGLAPWGSSGFRITTEFLFFATKGQRGLHSSPTDYLRFNRKNRSERLHAAEKPVDLLSELIKCSTLPGDFVLDPCCGSGSTLVAVKETKRIGMGIEKDKAYYDLAMSNVFSDLVAAQMEPEQ